MTLILLTALPIGLILLISSFIEKPKRCTLPYVRFIPITESIPLTEDEIEYRGLLEDILKECEKNTEVYRLPNGFYSDGSSKLMEEAIKSQNKLNKQLIYGTTYLKSTYKDINGKPLE